MNTNDFEFTTSPQAEVDHIRWELRRHVNKLNDRDVTRALMNYKPEGEAVEPAQDKPLFL